MKKNNDKLVDKLFLIILSVQTFLMGIAFITQILRIYFGEGKYTREICIEYIMEILPVLIIWIVMIIASFIYFFVVNRKEKNKVKLTSLGKLQALLRIAPGYTEGTLLGDNPEIKKEENKRLYSKLINLGVLVICSIMGLLYLVNPNHFDEGHPTDGIIRMSYCLLPWVIISLAASIASVFYNEASAKRELELVKQLIKSNGRVKPSYIPNKKMELIKAITTYSLLAVAVALIVVGIFDGSAKSVLLKAVVICTECIGLG